MIHERGIAMLGSDTGNDVMPTGYPSMSNPIHQVGIVAMGLWILDNANIGRAGAGLPRAQSVGVHAVHRTAAAEQHDRLSGEPDSDILGVKR